MRLRDFFRVTTGNERKSNISSSVQSLVTIHDPNASTNIIQDKDTSTSSKYPLADQSDLPPKSTPLHMAVETANMELIQTLLQAGAQVNLTDVTLSTPLHIATYMNNEEIVQILLSHGADMFKQDSTGRSPFHLAVSTGNNRLIQHFISVNNTKQNIIHTVDAQRWTPLMCACASNHPQTCALLLSHHADIRAVNDRGLTALHITAFLGSLSILQQLLTSSSNDEIIQKALNQGDHRNQTPLFYACNEGHLDIALYLLRTGANAYHLDNDNQTCLHSMFSSSIILKRHIRLFYYFIQFVDYRFHQDYLGRTLLDLAYASQINSIIDLLKLLNYKSTPSFESNNRMHSVQRKVMSLRHICILNFKRSIIYNRYQPQPAQYDLLQTALEQTFQIVPHRDLKNMKETRSIEYLLGKSLDDVSVLQQQQQPQQQQSSKYQKPTKTKKKSDKKSRKTANVCSSTTVANKWSSQTDLQHTHSTWSTLTNIIKGQRTPHMIINTQQMPIDEETNTSNSSLTHPMKNLVCELLTSPLKLDHLLDFPSLKQNSLLIEDLQVSMHKYKLLDMDLTNQT